MIYQTKAYENWVIHLPTIRRIMMTHRHTSTGIAPAALLHGNMVNLERGLFPQGPNPIQTLTEKSSSSSKLDSSWLQDMYTRQSEMLEAAQAHQRLVDAENLAARTEQSPPITEFEVGQYVLALYKDNHQRGKGQPPTKFLSIKRGPYRVISKSGNLYKVQNLAHDNIIELHVSALQNFVFDANNTDPFEVALGDDQEFSIESVVDHEKRPHPTPTIKQEQLFLLIKWEGFDDSHNSWEPISGLYHLPLIRDYLIAQRLTSYIPKSFRGQPEKNMKPRRSQKNK